MAKQDKILLVEGDADKNLFEAVCKKLEIDASVTVSPPNNFPGGSNTKGGMFNLLPNLLNQMRDGKIKRFAAVMDADSRDPAGGGGMGYNQTVEMFSNKVKEFKFTRRNIEGGDAGIYFLHNDGLNDIGLWVMPDNASDGITESWLMKCIINDEVNLLSHVDCSIKNLPQPPKFREIHRPKAEIATWLAWQKIPGQGAASAVKNGLINTDHPEFQKLAKWLKIIFQ